MSETILSQDKKVTINQQGVFVTQVKKLHPNTIKKRRIILNRTIQRRQLNIQQAQQELFDAKQELKELSNPIVNEYLKQYAKELSQKDEKAKELLKEFVGEPTYRLLEKQHKIQFKAEDGGSYKIDWKGRIFRKTKNGFEKLCIIRPHALPLPDFIMALLVNVKNHPKKYNLRRRR